MNDTNIFIKNFIDLVEDDYPNTTLETQKKLSKVLKRCLTRETLHQANIENGFSMLKESIPRDMSFCFFTAPMQSGKTKTFLACLIIGYYIYGSKIRSIFTSSLPRNKAFKQNESVINEANKIIKKEEGLDYDIVKLMKLDAIYKDLHGKPEQSKIQSYFNEDESSINLLFIDECHHGSGEDSRLHKSINKLIELYPYGRLKFILNSATNYDPKIILSQTVIPENNDFLPPPITVHAKVSNSYYGLERLLEDSELQEIKSGSDRKPKEFYKEVQQLVDHALEQSEENNSGALVMARICPSLNENKQRSNTTAKELKNFLEKCDPDVNVVVMNSTTGKRDAFNSVERMIKSGKVVCLIVTAYLSASDDLGIFLKTHVAGVIENFKSVQGIAQGLIGRILGHNINSVHKKLIVSKIRFIRVALELENSPDAMRLSGLELARIIQEQGIAEDDLYENRILLTTNTQLTYRSSFIEAMRKFVILPKRYSRLLSNGVLKDNESAKQLILKEALHHFDFHNTTRLSWTDPYVKDREGGTAGLFMRNSFRSSTSNRAWPLNDKSLCFTKEKDLKGFDAEKYDDYQNQITNLIHDPLSEPSLFSSIKENIIMIDSDGKIIKESGSISDSEIQKAFSQCRIIAIDGTKSYEKRQVSARSVSKSIKSKSCLHTLVHDELDSKKFQLELGLF